VADSSVAWGNETLRTKYYTVRPPPGAAPLAPLLRVEKWEFFTIFPVLSDLENSYIHFQMIKKNFVDFFHFRIQYLETCASRNFLTIFFVLATSITPKSTLKVCRHRNRTLPLIFLYVWQFSWIGLYVYYPKSPSTMRSLLLALCSLLRYKTKSLFDI